MAEQKDNMVKRLFRWLIGKLLGGDAFAQEYIERFIFPVQHELIDLGLTYTQSNELASMALTLSSHYRPWGFVYRDMRDDIKGGMSYDDVMQKALDLLGRVESR
jgi:hypothetical protein